MFAAHLRDQGEEHLLDGYPEYAEYLRSKTSGGELQAEALAEAPAEAERGPVPVDERIVERIVERQVVVIRCKFCQDLSSVDLERRKSCGAAKFY